MNETEMAERDDVSAPLLFGQGQAGWLAVVTVIAVVALVLAFVAVVMASDDSGGGGAASGGDSGPVSEATVAASEFAFDPADLTITAATEVPITLDNVGSVVHNWTVLSEEIAAEDEFSEDLVLAATGDVAAGESAEETISIDEAGTYQVICTISGHFDAGMVGELTVQ